MNRVCYNLQSQDMWLGLPVNRLFSTKTKANDYYQKNCTGCGIICKVRAKSESKKFIDGMNVDDSDVTITTNWRRKKG